MELAMGISVLAARARRAIWASYAVIGGAIIMAVLQLLLASGNAGIASQPPAQGGIFGVVAICWFIAYLVSVVFVAMWIYRGHSNLETAGVTGEVSPGWAIGWFFIPLANLVMPFKAMKQLYFNSDGRTGYADPPTPSTLWWWWGGHILSGITGQIALRISDYSTSMYVNVLTSVLTIIAASMLIRIINHVTQSQERNLTVAEVFE